MKLWYPPEMTSSPTRIIFFILAGLLVLVSSSASFTVGPIEKLARPHMFSIEEWEIRMFPEKWIYMAKSIGGNCNRECRLRDLQLYFDLGTKQANLRVEVSKAIAQGNARVFDHSESLKNRSRREDLRLSVEYFLERELSSLIQREGILLSVLGVNFPFPPVDIRFTAPPHVLVVSPRDQIKLHSTHLIKNSLSIDDMEELETRILQRHDLSSLVAQSGGLATYPAAVSDAYDLHTSLQIAAHEWLHHYLWFFPLGKAYNDNLAMRTLNETLADLVGKKLGDTMFLTLANQLSSREPEHDRLPLQNTPERFDFAEEMRQTRFQAEALLTLGRINEAEKYMEDRRQLFVNNGYFLRKLNQAYFAFHGTYASDPGSVSPFDKQLLQVRKRYVSLGDFVRAVAQVGNIEEFRILTGNSGV